MNKTDDQSVEVLKKEVAFQGYFRLDRYHLRVRTFEGAWTRPVTREVLERGHAVAVLLYDPVRDQVVLVEQFRIGALAAEMSNPWLLEPVAGIIDPGETPEAVARRESLEEANCTISTLEKIAEYIVSPGCCSETVILFIGRVDASTAGGVHGLEHEGENIKVHVLSVREAMRLLDRGRINAHLTYVALAWLGRHRRRLRERWLNTTDPGQTVGPSA